MLRPLRTSRYRAGMYMSARRLSQVIRKPRRTIIDIAKEWGGLAALAISIFVAFPFSIYDRIRDSKSSSEQKISELQVSAREAIAKMSSLRMEQADHFLKSSDPQYVDQVKMNYDFLIFNAAYSSINLFDTATPFLESSDLYAIGSNLAWIGSVEDSVRFYEAALDHAKEEGKFKFMAPRIYEEMGKSRLLNGPAKDIEMARQNYLLSMEILVSIEPPDSLTPGRSQFLAVKSELAAMEIFQGRANCGLLMANAILPEMQRLANFGDPNMLYVIPRFQEAIRSSQQPATHEQEPCYATPN